MRAHGTTGRKSVLVTGGARGIGARIIAAAVARFGRVDAVMHDADDMSLSPLDDFDPAAYRAMFGVNLFAAQGLLTAAPPQLGTGSAMVNISSTDAILPPESAATYGAGKSALDLWTRGAPREMGHRGIRIDGVVPGAIGAADTGRDDALRQAFVDMTALRRMGTPKGIADAVLFLFGDWASFITGEVLTVSGEYRL